MPRDDDSRAVSWKALRAVHHDGAYANLVLPRLLTESSLDQRDRAFVTELVYGALRKEGELDAVIESAANRTIDTIDDDTLDVLRLGVYQALNMRVLDHAVVDQSVRLAKSQGLQRSSGFVNAVLRKVTAGAPEHWSTVIESNADVVVSHPLWIVREIEQALEQCEGLAERDLVLEAHNEAPAVTLVLLPGLETRRDDDEPTRWSDLGVTLSQGDPGQDPRIVAGTARVQDEGSQLAALLLARVRPMVPGERILDMCAGPGGKTAVLAAEALQAGAVIVAMEKIPHRAALVKDSVRAITHKNTAVVEVVLGDATEVLDGSDTYDRILLDAPCTGLGALRRRPEARWRKSPNDIPALEALQKALLNSGLDALAEGGVLAYVTCSPVTRETTDVVRDVLARRDDVDVMDTPAVLDRISQQPVPGARRGSAVQLWTHRHGTDAMFIQLLGKKTSG